MKNQFFRYHFEWIALAAGLLLMGILNPYIDTGQSLCLFEAVGISNCPGEGLGHSIALTFRGDLMQAMQAHFMGPAAIFILSGRIFYLLHRAYSTTNLEKEEATYGQND